MKKIILLGALLFTAAQTSWAMEGHDSHGQMDHGMDHSMHGEQHMDMAGDKNKAKPAMFLVKQEVDGYTVTFHMMEPAANMQHGGSHNLMVKLEHGSHAIEDAAINSKVFYPDGTSESKMLMLMDGWYMNGYDLQGDGKHGLMILFKTADGKKHKVSVYYPEAK
jgi:hypothetical protein